MVQEAGRSWDEAGLSAISVIRMFRQLTRRSDCAVCSLPWSERGFYDLYGFTLPSMIFLEDSPLPKRAASHTNAFSRTVPRSYILL